MNTINQRELPTGFNWVRPLPQFRHRVVRLENRYPFGGETGVTDVSFTKEVTTDGDFGDRTTNFTFSQTKYEGAKLALRCATLEDFVFGLSGDTFADAMSAWVAKLNEYMSARFSNWGDQITSAYYEGDLQLHILNSPPTIGRFFYHVFDLEIAQANVEGDGSIIAASLEVPRRFIPLAVQSFDGGHNLDQQQFLNAMRLLRPTESGLKDVIELAHSRIMTDGVFNEGAWNLYHPDYRDLTAQAGRYELVVIGENFDGNEKEYFLHYLEYQGEQ